ncbi:UTRA domain-containing protein [Streptomonospora nanhaiensis]|uniref:GntR family transcriptional regulator n=1 Tax=Streptomonospora nanhaiensis TaxID=1323731 RepID=A0A853BS99_9ACTN|nr:UTRA domain-containing protein [Streptomonospora nanhaiensis]MBV2362882.1 UTRA domain-containing protein [Streptomonospora nanhaiensis]MBX9389373.1 UTRA domain-containing protein [Streptomonospora nanhaiensis]NYI97754.1 GntR family transcriptional regulator [Streptomonospora nanhaiensis]
MNDGNGAFRYPASREHVRDSKVTHDAFDQFVVDSGREPSKRLRVERHDSVPQPIADRLGTSAAVSRRAVRAIDGRTVAIETSYYPADLAEGTPLVEEADIPAGTISVLAGLGHAQTGYQDELTAHQIGPNEAADLGVAEGTPALQTVRTVWSASRVLRVTVTVSPLGGGLVMCYETGAPAPVAFGG